jgi:hypothetical protein
MSYSRVGDCLENIWIAVNGRIWMSPQSILTSGVSMTDTTSALFQGLRVLILTVWSEGVLGTVK